MKAILHLLAKDLRKFASLIALSVAIAVLGYFLALSNLDATRILAHVGIDLTKVFQQAPWACWAMVFLLSVWVVLEDRAVGDRTAWMTRPILIRDILIAKFVFLMVAVALPSAAVATGVALWLHAPIGAALLTGLSNFVVILFGAAAFAAVAVVCATMNQALLVTAGIFCSGVVVSYLLFQVAHVSIPAAPPGISGQTRLIVVVGMTSLASAATLSCQYVTRRTLYTVFVAAGAALAAGAIVRFWPVNIWIAPQEYASARLIPAENLKFVPVDTPADFRTDERVVGEPQASVLVPLRLEGAPPDWVFDVRSVTSTLALRGGATIVTEHSYANPSFENKSAAAAALGFAASAGLPTNYVAVVDLPVSRLHEVRGQIGRLSATVRLREMHYELIARLPARVSAQTIIDGRLSRVVSTQFTDGSCVIGFQFAQVSPFLGVDRPVWPSHLMLVNAKRGEYSEPAGGRIAGSHNPEIVFLTNHTRFGVTRDVHSSNEVGRVDAAWLADADICFLVGRVVLGSPVEVPLAIDKLVIPTKQVTRHVIIINPDGTRDEYDR